MEINPEADLVIFTHEPYVDMLPVVHKGTENIQDKIVNRYIISPEKIEYPGYVNLNDHDLWKKFDPEFKYQRLYDKAWYRQQILKLNLDCIEGISKNILILDGDVVIIKPMRFFENGKINYYMAGEYDRSFFNCNKILVGLNKVQQDSFISEAMIFRIEILESLRYYIRDFNKGQEWLSVIENALDQSLSTTATFCTTVLLSEYELYGSYTSMWYPDIVNKYIPSYSSYSFHQQRLGVPNWKNRTTEDIYGFVAKSCPNHMRSIMYK